MTDAALRLRNVNKAFGPTEIIRGVDLDIRKGERHAIIGPNGAGKTTLFNLISGRFPVSSGEILLNGTRVDGMPPHRINRMGLSRSSARRRRAYSLRYLGRAMKKIEAIIQPFKLDEVNEALRSHRRGRDDHYRGPRPRPSERPPRDVPRAAIQR